MARILCVTSSLISPLYSGLELARRLGAAGHRLTYASFPDARQRVQDHGLPFLTLEPSRYGEFLETDGKQGAVARLLTLRRRREQATEAMAVGNFAGAIRAVDPDLIPIDGELHPQIIAASATGVPLALLTFFVSTWRRPGLPPPHHLVRPGHGWRGTGIGMSALWIDLRLRKWRRAWVQKARHLGCDRVTVHGGLDKTHVSRYRSLDAWVVAKAVDEQTSA